jgi:hypothetical protein
VAAILPSYLEQSATAYFGKLGCQQFSVIAHVEAAPNVILIADATEVDDQGYETLLRDEKKVVPAGTAKSHRQTFTGVRDVLIFPGAFELGAVCRLLPRSAAIHIDAAYDVKSIRELYSIGRSIQTIFISTSSILFQKVANFNPRPLVNQIRRLGAEVLVLKENRGGSRVFIVQTRTVEQVPAILRSTANSVGVGDA